jgi:antitoxin component HigA of HigAB toxin-antitoxin module
MKTIFPPVHGGVATLAGLMKKHSLDVCEVSALLDSPCWKIKGMLKGKGPVRELTYQQAKTLEIRFGVRRESFIGRW